MKKNVDKQKIKEWVWKLCLLKCGGSSLTGFTGPSTFWKVQCKIQSSEHSENTKRKIKLLISMLG
jgi:hypothetical protein